MQKCVYNGPFDVQNTEQPSKELLLKPSDPITSGTPERFQAYLSSFASIMFYRYLVV
jgi:hypothetical protein